MLIINYNPRAMRAPKTQPIKPGIFGLSNIFSILFGVLHGLAFAPFNSVFALFISLIALFFSAIREASMQRVILNSTLFGFAYYLFSIHWITKSVMLDVEEFWYMIPLILIALPLYMSIYIVIPSVFAYLGRNRPLISSLLFAILWGLCEYTRTYLFTGFPWNPIGSVLLDFPDIATSIHYLGIHLFGFLVVFFILGLVNIWTKGNAAQKITSIALQTAALVLVLTLSNNFKTKVDARKKIQVEKTKFRIVQPNIRQSLKWAPESFEGIFKEIEALSFAGDIQDIKYFILPEAATPIVFPGEENEMVMLRTLAAKMSEGQFIVMGALREEGDQIYNSIIILNHLGEIINFYDKIRRVPFGEYVPLRTFFGHFNINAMSHFRDISVGVHNRFIDSNFKALPLICYEAVYPTTMNDDIDFLLTISNDAWFGRSFGPLQHLRLARIRAIEQARPMLRASNGGISALINSFGRIQEFVDLGSKGYIDVEI